jgi:hypothetical protein
MLALKQTGQVINNEQSALLGQIVELEEEEML